MDKLVYKNRYTSREKKIQERMKKKMLVIKKKKQTNTIMEKKNASNGFISQQI